MTRVLLQCPQTSRNSVSSLSKAAKPHLEPRLTHRRGLSPLPARSHLIAVPASWGGRWDQIGDRTRRPNSIVPRYGCLRSRPNNSVSRSPRTPLRRLSRPPRLPSRVERHLPHLAHPVLRSPGDNQRLVDPRLQL